MSNIQISNTEINSTVNVKLVDSLVQIIHTLSADEQTLLYSKLYDEPSTLELMHLAETAFQEWNDPEEDLYEPEP
ncbi:MAG: hypothetical protein KME13_25535 [Myxacorys californica WJT36-NPBG1]|jgi:hypothetical protein|nr:hypothetical protein [Myxacorys californica WJT36-NPBG1]